MEGCVPVVEVTPWVVHAIMAILSILALLAVILASLSCFYKLGVYADPRSILGVATLAQSPGVRSIFANVDPTARLKTLKALTGHIPLHLGTDPVSRDYGIQRSEQMLLQHDKADEPETSYLGDATQLGRMPVAKLAFLFACFTVFLMASTTLTIYYLVTSGDTEFERFMSGEGFGPRLIFTVCGVAVNFGWVYIFQGKLYLPPAPSLSLAKIWRGSHPPPAPILRHASTSPRLKVHSPILLIRPFLCFRFRHTQPQPKSHASCPPRDPERISSAPTRHCTV